MADIDDMMAQAEELMGDEPEAMGEATTEPDDDSDEDNSTLEGMLDEPSEDNAPSSFDENLALKLTDSQQNELVTRLIDLLKMDEENNSESKNLYDEGLKRTGLSKEAPGGASFEGASRTVHPIMAEAAIDFQSRILKELMPPSGIVKMKIDGKFDQEKWKRAKRKERKLNGQLTKDIEEYEPAMQQVMAQVAINGDQYMKFWHDDGYGRIRCSYVPGDRMVMPSTATSFYSAERKMELVSYSAFDFKGKVKSGFFLDDTLSQEPVRDPADSGNTSPATTAKKIIGLSDEAVDRIKGNAERYVYEIHTRLDWAQFDMEDFDVVAKTDFPPYIVHIDASEEKILAIYRNWGELDKGEKPKSYYVQWGLIPWRGPKAIGLVQLIGSLSGALTGIVRALLDAAHIQNSPTALKLRFGKATTKNYNIDIGDVNEFEAEPGIDDIRKMFMALPFNAPSSVLYQLLGDLDKLARGVIKTSFDNMAESNQNTPVGTTLNRVEQGLVVFSSIFERFHKTQQRVIDIVCRLNYENMDDAELTPADEEDDIAVRSDFANNDDVQPVSDPNIFSQSQRLAQAQMVMGLATAPTTPPGMYNLREVHSMMLEFAKIPNIDKILPEPENQQDENPVTENVKMGMGSPAFALPDQDHMAHLETHIKWVLSPMFGSSPIWQSKVYPLALEHLKQHVLLYYASLATKHASEALGVPIESIMDEDPTITEGISQLLALQTDDVLKEASVNLKQAMDTINLLEAKVQQMQMPPPMDPTQIAQQDVQLRAKDSAQKNQLAAQKLQTDAQLKQTDIETKKEIEDKNLAMKAQEISTKAAEAEKKNQTDILKNVQDNQTAMDIAGLRAVTGKSVGNLQNGDGLDPGNGV